MEETHSFGYWLRRRRRALDLTQAELGRRVGASEAMIRKIEADERRPSRELAELLATHLALPEDERAVFLRAARQIAAVEDLPPASTTPIGASLASPSLPPPSRLPAPMTSMVNRVHDLTAVTGLLMREDVRLVTLVGPPGMGKTRLSIQVAERLLPHFPDGAYFVDLAPIVDPDQVLPAVVTSLGLPLAPGMPPAVHLRMALADRRLLLILDNLEQVIESAPAISGLLRDCHGVKVLATSRIRLDVYGEQEYPLPAMSFPPAEEDQSPEALSAYEAVELFMTRARQHQPDFALTSETAAAVAEICRRMDGLPLALEIAAARTRRMPVGDLAAALRDASGRDWHALLQTTARDVPPRQQTLFGAISWSYSLLQPSSKAILAQLSVFAGPFDWPAVEAIVRAPSPQSPPMLREALEGLVDHNLVSVVSTSPERWRLLEMIREFARDQLNDGEWEQVAERHAQHYSAALAGLLQRVAGKAYHREVEAIIDNGRAALQWALDAGEARLAYRLGAAFEWYWEQRGLFSEGHRFLEQVLALTGEVDDELRFTVLHGAATLAWLQNDHLVAHRHTAAALELAFRQGDEGRAAGFLNQQARIYLEEGAYEEADRALIEGIRLGQLMPRRMSPHFMVIQRGEAALGMGRLDQAEALLTEGLAHIPKEDVIPTCVGWNNLAEVMLARGDADGARRALRQIAGLAPLHSRRLRVFLTSAAGLMLLERRLEDIPAAVMLLATVTDANRRLGDPLSPMTQRLLAARVESGREALSPEAWDHAWQEGERLTSEGALALANELLDLRR